jgi:hypothetical protein
MTPRGAETQLPKSRLLADLAQAMAAGHLLQASAVAVLVGRTPAELVQQALSAQHPFAPGSDERLQLYLRNVVGILKVAERHFGDVQLAVHWYRNAQAGQRAPEALAEEGRLEDAYRLLLRAQLPQEEGRR